MGRLNAELLRRLSKDDFRTLTAIELGMKNHELVPAQLAASISGLKYGLCQKILRQMVEHKLVSYSHTKAVGYRLTFAGYDFLALRVLTNRDSIASIGSQIGVGKESDIYVAADANGKRLALKLHRLGRSSFRRLKEKRDYHQHRSSMSWLYLSRLAAAKEHAFMKVLYENGFPVPCPLDTNRHCIVMELKDGYPLCQVHNLADPAGSCGSLLAMVVQLAEHGLIHSDFNEFNILVDGKDQMTLIDFPQMVSTAHFNAEWYFDRDVDCVCEFFKKKYCFEVAERPTLAAVKKEKSLDVEVKASGYYKDFDPSLIEAIQETVEGISQILLDPNNSHHDNDSSHDDSSNDEDEDDDEDDSNKDSNDDDDDDDDEDDNNDDDDADDEVEDDKTSGDTGPRPVPSADLTLLKDRVKREVLNKRKKLQTRPTRGKTEGTRKQGKRSAKKNRTSTASEINSAF